MSRSKVMQLIDWTYEKAITTGIPGFGSAIELADDYYYKDGDLIDNVNLLIRWQNTKAGTSGFVTGVGGFAAMPVTLPANITSVIYIQVRMIAAIAHMGGYDLHDDRVKTLVYACLAGNAGKDILKNVGINVGQKLAVGAIKNISGKTIIAINQKIGFRLITKFGEKGAVNLGKAVPLIGGLIGGTVDSVTTNVVGNFARDLFIDD